MKLFAILPLLLLLTACDQKGKSSDKDESAALSKGNTMSCVVGDVKLAGTGETEVGIAGFGILGTSINGFGLSLSTERAGKDYEVSSSLMVLPLQAGTYHFPSLNEPGSSLAYYNEMTTERDLIKGYNGGTYGQQFSPIENDPEAKLKVQVDKASVSDASLPGFKRIHVAGHFEFNAAALPDSSPSEACISDGIARSIASINAPKRLLPLFDAGVCGADKKHVRCDFDVVAEFIKQE
jgi:hypothetical protein